MLYGKRVVEFSANAMNSKYTLCGRKVLILFVVFIEIVKTT